MVHIKKVEIFGFKSFGFKNTIVQFEPGLVSISGPNGSGKSNILDAIIFATCEKTPKMMRVDKIRDLLHDVGGAKSTSGNDSQTNTISKSSKSRRMARVALHFDNTDRKIPVPSDNVSITRELEEDGEATYYLNGKKDNRSHIVDMLDVAHVGPGNLNVVQQGTVTRIAEYTSVEKRRAIEDLIGISSFDDKVEKATDQLDYADRKLEVALASMGEVKNQIDNLEVERNAKLRYDLIQKDLKRYRAIDAIAQLRKLRTQRTSKESELSSMKLQIDELKTSRDECRSSIKELDGKRSAVLNSEAEYRPKKAALESKIRDSVDVHDKAESKINISMTNIQNNRTRLDVIATDMKSLSVSQNYTNGQIKEKESFLEEIESSRDDIDEKLKQVNSEIRDIIEEQRRVTDNRTKIDDVIKKLRDEDHSIIQKKLHAIQNRTNYIDQINEYNVKLEKSKQLESSLENSINDLNNIIKNSRDTISTIEIRIKHLDERRSKAVSDKDDLELVLEKSSNVATKYESKIKTVKGFMYEDYATAKLKENAQSLGILGLVYEVMTWSKEYERPVMAASSDWIKAIVVRDFDALLGISEATRIQKLPKCKIIPMDAIQSMFSSFDTGIASADTISDNNNNNSIPRIINGVSTLGVLAEYIQCSQEYIPLRTFLFGNVILVTDRNSAIAVSKFGYKAVTIHGEYFEARGSTVIVDINSKISKVTRLISMSSDVDGLFKSISLVKRYIQKKKNSIKKIDDSIQSYRNRIPVSADRLTNASSTLDYTKLRLKNLKESLAHIPNKLSEFNNQLDGVNDEIALYDSQIQHIKNEISLENDKYASSESMSEIGQRLATANSKKSNLEAERTTILASYDRLGFELSNLRSAARQLETDYAGYKREETSLTDEIPRLEESIKENAEKKESMSKVLEQLRETEQEMIRTSGLSMSEIKKYDDLLGNLNTDERSLTNKINSFERESENINRELDEMTGHEAELTHIVAVANSSSNKDNALTVDMGTDINKDGVSSVSVNGTIDGNTGNTPEQHNEIVNENDQLDVSQIVSGLESELENLTDLNANAPATYTEIAHGYKMKSVRKNSLESERNSIVAFIDRIEREKRQTFLEAFDTVNSEISRVFKKMTGGGAWLELQDEDDIFSSGISYLVQFPDKPSRASTSISGGEKTLAAVVFVLGLQKLQPSPFYLFDEVDAHLDAPNSEKLSNILAERARESQFIVVSLKDSVVQKASLVYGVYPKAGVSNVVTYKDRRFPTPPSPKPVSR